MHKITWNAKRMTAVSPSQECRLYMLGIPLALWKSKTAFRPRADSRKQNCKEFAFLDF